MIFRIADLVEQEIGLYLKRVPDPFDDRHPSRINGDCAYGRLLKSLPRYEDFIDKVVQYALFH